MLRTPPPSLTHLKTPIPPSPTPSPPRITFFSFLHPLSFSPAFTLRLPLLCSRSFHPAVVRDSVSPRSPTWLAGESFCRANMAFAWYARGTCVSLRWFSISAAGLLLRTAPCTTSKVTASSSNANLIRLSTRPFPPGRNCRHRAKWSAQAFRRAAYHRTNTAPSRFGAAEGRIMKPALFGKTIGTLPRSAPLPFVRHLLGANRG